nr:Ig-like domain repeat protein [Methanobrevibacter sp. TMH8]
MSFINCSFINNSAQNDGGAIYNQGHNLSITNCTFTNNIIFNNHGGAIHNRGDNMNIVDSTFINNNASTFGGAIYTAGNNMNVSNSTFINNTARIGGAITINAFNSTISGSTFINNNANTSNGGAIYVQPINGNISIIKSTFEDNNALFYGGAVFSQCTINVYYSTFTNNTACTNGGAIHNNGVNSTVSDSNFIGNSAKQCGGAISNEGVISLFNSNFIGNSAINFGGGIFNQGNMSVSGNVMSGNVASVLGQMIYNNGSIGVLNLTYLGNSTVKVSKGSNVTVYATLTDDMGNTVTGQDISFYVDGVFVANVTSIEGKANTTYLVTQGPGSVIPVTGDYAGHENYTILVNNGELLVPMPTSISINVPKEVKVGDTVTLVSKLTDNDGNPIANATVDFYINGEKVGSAKTDANGIAKFNYKYTKTGTYTITSKFAGNEMYLPSSASSQTKVSKVLTKISIQKEGNKVIVTLTDENGNFLEGKTIYVHMKGKVIKVGVTNQYGQIIFEYDGPTGTLKASFLGDNQFAPSSASIDISNNNPNNNPKAYTINKAEMKSTGMPVVQVLIAILAIFGLISFKRRK